MLRAAVFLSAVVAASAGLAQDGRAARYAFVPVPDGTLRLDTRTGEVLHCAGSESVIRCQPLTRPGGAAEEIDELRERLAALEHDLARLQSEASQASGTPLLRRVAVLAQRVSAPLLEAVRHAKRQTMFAP